VVRLGREVRPVPSRRPRAAFISDVAVLDADWDVRRAFARLLRVAGYRVRTYRSAEEFLSADIAGAVGCLVLDVHLEGISGLRLHQELAHRHLSLPMVFVTADDNAISAVEALPGHDAIACLRKPCEDAALIAAVADSLASH